MDSFDKNIRELFDSNAKGQNVPSGYEWDDMQAGIYQKMGSKERRRRALFWWTSGLGSLLLITAVFFLWPRNSEKQLLSEGSILSNTASNATEQFITETKQSQNEFRENEIKKKHSITTNKRKDDNVGSISKSLARIRKNDGTDNLKMVSHSNNLKSIRQKPKKVNSSEKIDGHRSDKVKFDLNKELSKLEKTKTNNIPSSRPIDGLEILPFKNIFLFNNGVMALPNSIPLAEVSETVTGDLSTTIWSPYVDIAGGTLLTTGKYSGIPNRNQYNSWKPGYHANVNLGVKNSKGWMFDIGYGYSNSVQYFELIGTDEVMVTQPDVVTSIVTNSLTGVMTSARSSLTSNVDRERNYQVYNETKSHGISVLAGRQFMLGERLSLEIMGGLEYSFGRDATGYTVDSINEVFQYGGMNKSIYSKTNIEALGQMAIGYELGRSFVLITYLSTNKSLSNLSTEADVILVPLTLRMGTGFRLQF